ncbi:FtsX-like permease family protein [Clostridium ganghwense]|uniref:ABC transporter permease n=1 Tax=Clostridium ganghwense TaxID=312089 RepID=A0ABT4CK07_9CLOT|nr:ABC transporter permease [Clostridium ganghwense]MCY6369387.1 ABC transporter permease [Clostridium ganghwense]
MLTKLAFKNVGKSFKEYAIYFFTLAFGVCVFYMFNSIEAQQGIMEVTKTQHAAMKTLTQVLKYISIFVAVVLGFLIVYANNFFIKRRKKELGVYLALGMEKSKISAILVLETSLIAIFALIIGIISGVFLSQFMSVFTAKIFEADLTAYEFVFSMDAVVKSILYFGIIFITVIVFNTAAISKYKLIDLIYGDRKNETLKIKNIMVSFVLFIISVMCLGCAYYLIIKNGMKDLNWMFTGSIIFGTMGTILFFFSLTGFSIKLIQKNENLYFKNLNMFVLRQLNSKINTNFVSMSVVCILLLLTIGILSTGISMENVLSTDLRKTVPFDFTFHIKCDETPKSIIDNLPQNINAMDYIKKYDEYTEYNAVGINYDDIFKHTPDGGENKFKFPLSFISLTDYNEILAMMDKEPLTLKDNSYIIVSKNEMLLPHLEEAVENNTAIEIDGKKVYPQGEVQKLSTNNFSSTYFVVNDGMISNMNPSMVLANIDCFTSEGADELDDKLSQYVKAEDHKKWSFSYYISKTQIYQQSISTKALVSFLAIYLGFVFLITSTAILALQQLSEAADNKKRYDLLLKLGVDKGMINKALFMQIACYFVLPLCLAVVHSIVGLTVVHDLIEYSAKVNILGSIFLTAGFIVSIYGAYFIATFMGSKSIINK